MYVHVKRVYIKHVDLRVFFICVFFSFFLIFSVVFSHWFITSHIFYYVYIYVWFVYSCSTSIMSPTWLMYQTLKFVGPSRIFRLSEISNCKIINIAEKWSTVARICKLQPCELRNNKLKIFFISRLLMSAY